MEVVASLGAVVALGGLASTKLDTTLAFFGTAPEVTAADVSSYHRWLLVLGVSLVVCLASALRRNSPHRRSLVWHTIVLFVGMAAAVLFHVGLPAVHPAPTPSPDLTGRVCHSGGDSEECVGG